MYDTYVLSVRHLRAELRRNEMAVRKLVLCAILAMCLAIVVPASAGTLDFIGTTFSWPGSLELQPRYRK